MVFTITIKPNFVLARVMRGPGAPHRLGSSRLLLDLGLGDLAHGRVPSFLRVLL
jgi:hypothetical protein